MKNKTIRALMSVIIPVVLTMLCAFTFGLFHIDKNEPAKINTPQISTTHHQTKNTTSHKWTTWSESKYPEMYRINGKADIIEKANPGDIQYKKDAHSRTYIVATLTKNNLEYGKRKRSDISEIKPEGWIRNKRVEIKFADGTIYHGYFWNRSHLLAHMLGGEDEAKNLITGTRCQNVGKNDTQGGMQYAENKAANYIRKGGKYIIYNVYPIYAKGDILPRSVFIDMLSDDNTINEQVEIYNVAPGYEIDYSTGQWHATS